MKKINQTKVVTDGRIRDLFAYDTRYSEECFDDVYYVIHGKLAHILCRITLRQVAAATLPEQLMSQWPKKESIRLETMCHKFEPISTPGIQVAEEINYAVFPCRQCFRELPKYLLSKACQEMIGMKDTSWLHCDSDTMIDAL